MFPFYLLCVFLRNCQNLICGSPPTGDPLAFHFGTQEHKNLDELMRLLEPFDINIVYSDNNFAYQSRIIDSEEKD
jgi:IS1 family transposase